MNPDTTTPATPTGAAAASAAAGNPIWRWFDRTVLSLGRDMRWSYLPPLMVYVAAGVSGLTGIVGTFFVKEYLGLSAAFLAALGFWAGIPWALKMPLGHLVDLIWRWKAWLVWLGASVIAASLLIMYGLIAHTDAMVAIASKEAWFVASALLSPVGFVIQDCVADAMTVEAVPRLDGQGNPVDPEQRKLMHTTMQMLGRVAIIGGTVLVGLINVWMFQDAAKLPEAEKVAIYGNVYAMALVIPLLSVLGVILAGFIKRNTVRKLAALGKTREEIARVLYETPSATRPNWWILGGSLVFVAITLTVGLGGFSYGQEIIFAGSMAVIVFLMVRLTRELDPDAQRLLIGTAVVVFIFRAMPGPGAGATWWFIDELGFDQQFLAKLSLLGSLLTLAGLFIFRRFIAEHSIATIVVFLTIAGTILALPTLGMYHGLHHWTAAMTGGVVDAHFIAVIDTALESPLGQIAMIPMLAWIANSAPEHLKATFFAVMASFTNLALSASQLGTKYLNQVFDVTRQVKDATGAIKVPADYSELGMLLVTVMVIGFVLPMAAVAVVRMAKLRTA
jgi:MFS family permease